MAGVEGFEPSPTVLETGMLPLHQTPKSRHILIPAWVALFVEKIAVRV